MHVICMQARKHIASFIDSIVLAVPAVSYELRSVVTVPAANDELRWWWWCWGYPLFVSLDYDLCR